ncbi:Uncharacterised protein [Salmonella enterica subsp. arizonae]|uniref:Uncharacterized protein n=1 Tax=Salmonella enterica subsp. arizonae TaxID=59203 RepID=A0A2X4WJW6_SALER|nr:Uncharacterised protein [Salmonella enterica subsp. arizonae]
MTITRRLLTATAVQKAKPADPVLRRYVRPLRGLAQTDFHLRLPGRLHTRRF